MKFKIAPPPLEENVGYLSLTAELGHVALWLEVGRSEKIQIAVFSYHGQVSIYNDRIKKLGFKII